MLRELLAIFRGGDEPLIALGKMFRSMLQTALDNTLTAGEIFFREGVATPEERTALYEKDIVVNKTERRIRKRVVAHLGLPSNLPDVPYCLLLMSLVKDVERLGDYAKNLSEARELHPEAFPDDEIFAELRAIRQEVETAFKASAEIFASSDRERALTFIHAGRDVAHRCDALLRRITNSQHDATTLVAAVLATRYYKRIGGHVLNILSSVVMPLHKVDYYDESVLQQDDNNDDE